MNMTLLDNTVYAITRYNGSFCTQKAAWQLSLDSVTSGASCAMCVMSTLNMANKMFYVHCSWTDQGSCCTSWACGVCNEGIARTLNHFASIFLTQQSLCCTALAWWHEPCATCLSAPANMPHSAIQMHSKLSMQASESNLLASYFSGSSCSKLPCVDKHAHSLCRTESCALLCCRHIGVFVLIQHLLFFTRELLYIHLSLLRSVIAVKMQ